MTKDEAWVRAVEQDLAKLSDTQRSNWCQLFHHCVGAISASPEEPWSAQALELLQAVGVEEFHERLFTWLQSMSLPRLTPPNRHGMPPPLSIEESNQNILRGLAWCVALQPIASSPRLLANLAISMFRKIPRIGSRAVRVGNACVLALNTIGTEDAVAKLSLLKFKVKNGTALRMINSQLLKTAERLGVTPIDLEELSVPTYDMEEVGKRSETVGDYIAQLTIDGNTVDLQWSKQDGSLLKSVPTAIKSSHAEVIKELKGDAKDLASMLSGQRQRLENLYLLDRAWPMTVWRERLLNHPLVGTLARRLIWTFDLDGRQLTGIYHEGLVRGVDDQPLEGIESSTVRLWHPIIATRDSIAAWRNWLFDHSVTQPFKQAHREIYVLTPAEEATETYSNRFAAHILRQSHYRGLASARGWQVNLVGAWDGGDEGAATRLLTPWNLRAEFTVAPLDELQQFTDVEFVSTDQVCFCARDTSERIPLRTVPPLAFSEILRDVDLFVGVASLGNDPNWGDRGAAENPHIEYWGDFSFGELTETGKTRHDVLKQLLPRLKIAPVCQLDGRNLVVQGKYRTYKIHLGSSNIRMSPDDRYLCIVPGRQQASHTTYLPYEGDQVLSVILSKAFMLADDDKIKDESILQQIR